MNTTYILIFIIVVLVISALFSSDIPKKYQSRKCMGKMWLQTFPNSSKSEIRNFLSLFSKAFLIKPNNQLKFEPNDSLYQIYRAYYPSKLTPDAMELETFSLLLAKQYGFKLESIWSEQLTLGEVFRAINNA